MFDEDDHDSEIDRAIELIREIQAEEVVVVKSIENGRVTSVIIIDHDDAPAPKEGREQETVSWLGTYSSV
jgi:hypothetical protein